MSDTFIPGMGDFTVPPGVHYSKPVRLITVVNDYRLRFRGEPLPGDRFPLKDGTPGVVILVRRTETGYALCLAPEVLMDREKYFCGEPIPVPLKDPMFEPAPESPHVVSG